MQTRAYFLSLNSFSLRPIQMRFFVASILSSSLHHVFASTTCSGYNLQQISQIPISFSSSTVQTGWATSTLTCYTALATNQTVQEVAGCSSCSPTSTTNLLSADCKLCSQAAAVQVAASVYPSPAYTNSTCNASDATALANLKISTYTSCVNGGSDSTTCLSKQGVSQSCGSCTANAFNVRLASCNTACPSSMSTTDIALCEACQQAEYLAASSVCLVSSAFAGFGGVLVSTVLMVVILFFGH